MSRITPAMSDGRSFTNYVSSGIYNTVIEQTFALDNDTEYRKYLQAHPDKVLKYINQLKVVDVPPAPMKGRGSPVLPFDTSSMPFKTFGSS